MAQRATGTYPAYVPASSAPSPGAAAPASNINSQGGTIVQTSSDQFQAAKYFTFVFFGLSVFVIVLFAGYVLVHCYRRVRLGPPLPSPADAEAGQAAAPAKLVPMKQGYMVTNPDGGVEVAYVSEASQGSASGGGAAAGGGSPAAPLPPAAGAPPGPAGGAAEAPLQTRQSSRRVDEEAGLLRLPGAASGSA